MGRALYGKCKKRRGGEKMLAIGFSKQEKSLIRNIRIGAFLTFIGINLRFIVGEIIKPLILFDVLQPGGHSHHRYEFHTPNLPDMCGDFITIVILAFAYFFMTSSSFKKNIKGMMYSSCDKSYKYHESIRKIRDYLIDAKNIFIVTAVGFGLYFFSKYALTIGLEAFSSEESESEGIPHILNIFNHAIKLLASLAFVYAYCKYISANRLIKPVLYTFFFIKSLLLTNVLGFVHEFDLEMIAPVLDVMLPWILIYSTIDFIARVKAGQRKEIEYSYLT